CIECAIRSKTDKTISNLEYIARGFPEYTGTKMEKIRPFVRPLRWTTPVRIHIDNSKKDAKTHHDNSVYDQDTRCISTDGSATEGQIGAAAHCPMLVETKRQ